MSANAARHKALGDDLYKRSERIVRQLLMKVRCWMAQLFLDVECGTFHLDLWSISGPTHQRLRRLWRG